MIFENYAKYYDLIYSDKNYQSEADYICKILLENLKEKNLNSILDVGCGSGKHLNYISKSLKCNAVGIDPSEEMIKIAKENFEGKSISFHTKSGQDFHFDINFDVILSLFHVFSYQINKSDLVKYLNNIEKHLSKRGLFIFDFWFKNAVEEQIPELRVKKFENEEFDIIRIATPECHFNKQIVKVNYDIFINQKNIDDRFDKISETHVMKYFSLEDIIKLLNQHNFKVIKFEEFLTKSAPNKNTWGVCCIAEKNEN